MLTTKTEEIALMMFAWGPIVIFAHILKIIGVEKIALVLFTWEQIMISVNFVFCIISKITDLTVASASEMSILHTLFSI